MRSSEADARLTLSLGEASRPCGEAQHRHLNSLMSAQEVARRMPGALLVVLLGLVIAVIQYPSVLRTLRLGPSLPQIVWPTWDEWKKGTGRYRLTLWSASITLVPLCIVNVKNADHREQIYGMILLLCLAQQQVGSSISARAMRQSKANKASHSPVCMVQALS